MADPATRAMDKSIGSRAHTVTKSDKEIVAGLLGFDDLDNTVLGGVTV